jgi:hypothetical protein
MNYYDRQNELRQLAFRDEADSYEVDETGIYTDGNIFYILSASGCSCWESDEYDEVSFNDFESVKNFLLGDGEMERYNPSLYGAKALVEEAERNLVG